MSRPINFMPKDERPKNGAWAPGGYLCRCANCGCDFEGDKRALVCAECAYNNGWRLIESAPKDGTQILVCLWEIRERLVVEFDTEAPDPLYPWVTLDGPRYHADAPTHWRPLPEPPPR